ncbi:hypothetical protein JZ751_013282 [Albula glossodonta]|uniref:Septin-type G domain-containing protein n=1 Tax=Albula glossodonta TaxID=121402 RepID=A0A8T2NU60_9TELE|nr:hypothetical protein JZ751_013282 [Albula glossodonta]
MSLRWKSAHHAPRHLCAIEEIREELRANGIDEMIPFAVVGSDQEYQVNGRRILGRKTKWGTIEGREGHMGSSQSGQSPYCPP